MTARLPSRVLRGTITLHRIHRAGNDPWWFSKDGSGRFDPVGTGLGACYLALDPLGAFVEVFRKPQLIDEADLRSRRLFSVQLGHDVRLVDLLARRGLAVGVTASFGADQDHTASQALAVAAVAAGAAGVRYLVRHDPAQRLVGVALFSADHVRWPSGEDREIPRELVEAARRVFGYRVLPAP